MTKISLIKLLYVGLFVGIAAIFAIAGFGVYQQNKAYQSLEQMYEHPFTVSTAIRDARYGIRHIWLITINIVYMGIDDGEAQKQIPNIEKEIEKNLDIVNSHYLGKHSDVIDVYNSYYKLDKVMKEAVRINNTQSAKSAAQYLKDNNATQLNNKLVIEIEDIVNFSSAKAREIKQKTYEDIGANIYAQIELLLLVLVSGLTLAFLLMRLINRQFDELGLAIDSIKHNNYKKMTVSKNEPIEFTNVKEALNKMVNDISEQKKVIEKQNEGLMEQARDLEETNTELDASLEEATRISVMMENQGKRYITLLDSASDGIFIMDANGDLLEFSDMAVKMLGYTRDEMHALNVVDWDAMIPKEELPNILKTTIDAQVAFTFETKHKRKDGSIYDAGITAKGVELDGKPCIFASVRDITEHKKLEDELKALNNHLALKVDEEIEKRLEKERLLAQQSKLAMMGEMIGNIAHQWRQPLNALGLRVQDVPMALEFGELDSKYAQKLSVDAMGIIQYMSQTIDDFRNFFKPSKEKIRFNICDNLKAVANLVSGSMSANNIKLKLECCNNDVSIIGFPSELNQAIINIVNNAKDIIKERNVKNGLITIGVKQEQNAVVIKISDNGGGIPDEVQDKIFEPYFTTKFASKGTGLGLYMTKMIIESMDGKIYAKNDENGAVFTIEI